MLTKQKILDEIKRTAQLNDGKPLGKERFEKETGIGPYDWGQYWPRFSSLQQEAGFIPNQLQSAYSEEFLIEKMVGLTRKLGKLPTGEEVRVEKNIDPEFPHKATYQRLWSQIELTEKIIDYCEARVGYGDVIDICKKRTISKKHSNTEPDPVNSPKGLGEVYLFKSGRYYKIGKTNDTVRRGKELRIQLPEKMEMIHSIATDDPSGIEAYWHKRLASKRMNGEWFDLDSSDIKAFKRWKKIS